MINKTMATLVNQFMFGQATSTSIPSYWYLGILRTKLDPTDFNGNISGKEITNQGYARVRIPNTADYFQVSSSSAKMGYVTNKRDIIFNDITGGGNSPIAGFFLTNAQTGSTAYIWGNLTTVRTAYQNSRVVVKAGALNFSITNTEGTGTIAQGLTVDDQGVLSGNMSVSTVGVLS